MKARNPDHPFLAHRIPYWPCYPTLAEAAGFVFVAASPAKWPGSQTVTCGTSPNNPDGHQGGPVVHVWDAAYAHEVYGYNGRPMDSTCSVWSASKLLGLSGERVGWISTNNEAVAVHAARAVEAMTSGVCTSAQRRVAAALEALRLDPSGAAAAYDQAKRWMSENGWIFQNRLGVACDDVQGVPEGQGGMFAWFRITKHRERFDDALERSHVLLVPGEACGMPPHSGWWRMSMGAMPEETAAALDALREAMDA